MVEVLVLAVIMDTVMNLRALTPMRLIHRRVMDIMEVTIHMIVVAHRTLRTVTQDTLVTQAARVTPVTRVAQATRVVQAQVAVEGRVAVVEVVISKERSVRAQLSPHLNTQ